MGSVAVEALGYCGPPQLASMTWPVKTYYDVQEVEALVSPDIQASPTSTDLYLWSAQPCNPRR